MLVTLWLFVPGPRPGFMAHGHCYLWTREILWASVVGDGLTVLAYYCIPAVLLSWAKTQDAGPARALGFLFGAFIISCGNTHVGDLVVTWAPHYYRHAALKLICGLISCTTLIELWRDRGPLMEELRERAEQVRLIGRLLARIHDQEVIPDSHA